MIRITSFYILFIGMVHYRYDWCVEDVDGPKCVPLNPWDCSDPIFGGCLSLERCCKDRVKSEYPGRDINGNELQCFSYNPNPNPALPGCLLDRKVIMYVKDGKVSVPARIPMVPRSHSEHLGKHCNYL